MQSLEPYEVTQVADLETNVNVYVNRYRFDNGYEVVTTEKPFREEWRVETYDSMGRPTGDFDNQDIEDVMFIIESVAFHEDNHVISDEALDDWEYASM